jgi:type III secretion protein N (ATPase)
MIHVAQPDPEMASPVLRINGWTPERLLGNVIDATGQYIRATVPKGGVGDVCTILADGGRRRIPGEITAVFRESVTIAALGDLRGVSAGTPIALENRAPWVAAGDSLLGETVDFEGRPLDPARLPPFGTHKASVYRTAPNPISRPPISERLETGVRAIDMLLTIGKGQRVGIFAPAGCGKSTLCGMIARGIAADVDVCALIGERGREVREFIENELPEQTRSRTITVVATSDRPAMERVRASYAALTLCEHYRDQGKTVVLLFDSLTRYARALREVALAAGELPSRRGFPPSVFATMPQLIERTGAVAGGSITAFFTVLVEGEELGDPIAEEAKSLLDGHVSLNSGLAAEGHFPAIDVLASLSRCMKLVAADEQIHEAATLRQLMSRYKDVELLLKIGEYKRGADRLSDIAIGRRDEIRSFLCQRTADRADFDQGRAALAKIADLDR